MSSDEKIEKLEKRIERLGTNLCDTLKPHIDHHALSSIKSDFMFNRYSEAIESINWFKTEKELNSPSSAIETWEDIQRSVAEVKELYEFQRKNDGGYKDPITHMNALMIAGDEIPRNFGKRYDISSGAVKSLWLTSPAFEERFIRARIRQAKERNGARTGHYIYTKRRYRISDDQARTLVDGMWKKPNSVSNHFHKIFDRTKLIQCRVNDYGKEEMRKILEAYAED